MSKLSYQEVITAILNNGYSNDELNGIAQSVQHARKNMAIVNKFSMRVGQHVKFDYQGSTHKGIVEKINKVKIKVRITESSNSTWIGHNCPVPANMLTPV
jgi:hypothetical protein